jgi:hypothetical protein
MMHRDKIVAGWLVAAVLALVIGCNTEQEVVEPPPPPEEKVTWDEVKARVIAPKCLQCHSAAVPIAGVDLSTQASAIAVGKRLCGVVESGRMPPAGPLDPELVELLCEWVSLVHPSSASSDLSSIFY